MRKRLAAGRLPSLQAVDLDGELFDPAGEQVDLGAGGDVERGESGLDRTFHFAAEALPLLLDPDPKVGYPMGDVLAEGAGLLGQVLAGFGGEGLGPLERGFAALDESLDPGFGGRRGLP